MNEHHQTRLNMKKSYILILFSFLFSGLWAQTAGDPDLSFGDNGLLLKAIGAGHSESHTMAVQPDGKIVMAGIVQIGSSNNADFALIRINPDGSLDNSFGENGVVTATAYINDQANAVAIQPDGKILISGQSFLGGSAGYQTVVMRFSSTGVVDNSFGTNGKVTITPLQNTNTMALQSDGKILVAGAMNDNFGMARLNTNGTLDTSFGTNGYVMNMLKDEWGADCVSYIMKIALQTNGKIVASGFAVSPNNYNDIAIARYNTNGSLDNSFATGGVLMSNLGGLSDFGTSVKIQPDGKIVIGAHKEIGLIPGVPEYDAAIIRLNVNGTYDNSFGTNGVSYIHLTEEATYVSDIALQDDGKIVVAGQYVIYTASQFDFFVARLNADGSTDTSFGTGGHKIYNPYNTNDDIKSVLIQNDGKIVVSGHVKNPNTNKENFFAMRVHPTTTTPQIPDVDVTFSNVTSTSLDATLTPNEFCESYHFVLMTPAEMLKWTPFMGSPEAVIKQFGIQKNIPYTHHFTELMPNTDYYVYTISVGAGGYEAPYDSTLVHTLSLGGNGVATASIVLQEITQTSVRMIVTPNDQTAEYHDGLMTKAYFDELGEAAAIEYFKNDGNPLYGIDDWVWPTLEPNTIYKAIAVGKNALGEWGPATIEEFTTLTTSLSDKKEMSGLRIYPNPVSTNFELTTEGHQGATICIIAANGEVVYNSRIHSAQTHVDVSKLSSGAYVIEMIKDGKTTSSTFIKN